MRKKRFLAMVLSAAMVMGSTVIASAADVTTAPATGTLTGSGRMEGQVQTDVFAVVVPTTALDALNSMDFILDPQELIKKTDGARYLSTNSYNSTSISVDSFGDITTGSMYFVNSGNGTTYKLSPTSEKYTVINKSTMEVSVSINAQLKNLDPVSASDTKTFEDKDATSIYMAVKPVGGTEAAISTGDACLAKAMVGDAKDLYDTVYVSDNSDTYKYELPSANQSSNQLKKFEYQLTGACNTEADWSNVSFSGTPQVDVTYWIGIPSDTAPSIAKTEYTMVAGEDLEVAVDLGYGKLAATDITKITYQGGGQTKELTKGSSGYTFGNGKLTIASSYIDAVMAVTSSREYTIEFNDTAKTSLVITLKK